jgi:spermidine/putrescine-binding protein
MIDAISSRKVFTWFVLVATLVLAPAIGEAVAQEKVLNLYTARHYATDEAFYTGYTKAHQERRRKQPS